jgi:hypothetical protein
MQRLVTVGSVLTALGLAVTGLTTAASGAVNQAQRTVAIKIVGIDRAGHRVPVFGNVVTLSGAQVITGSSGGSLAPGTYIVGADVETNPGQSSLSQSLVVRQVRVMRSETITLDARTARAVHVSLGVHGATDQLNSALVTARRTDAVVASANGLAGSLFATPAGLRPLCFGFASRWQAGAGQFYDLSAIVSPGVPAAPTFRFRPAQLAKVRLSVRSGIGSGVFGVSLQPGDPDVFTCAAGLLVNPIPVPLAETDFMSAGIWTESTQGSSNGDTLVTSLRARHFYQVSLGDAVAAPAGEFPFVPANSDLMYMNDGIFSYPLGRSPSFECCAKSIGTLKLGLHVLERAKFTEPLGLFQKTLSRSGWYTLTVDSIRVGFQGQPLRGLLSSHITVSWRFYATTASSQGFPLTLASYLPAGLSVHNSAKPRAVTTLRILISRPADSPGTPVYTLKPLRMQISGNDGKSWKTVRATRSGRYWIAEIHDPASGYVSLRSTVTDVHGDSTTETIYRAYAIS